MFVLRPRFASLSVQFILGDFTVIAAGATGSIIWDKMTPTGGSTRGTHLPVRSGSGAFPLILRVSPFIAAAICQSPARAVLVLFSLVGLYIAIAPSAFANSQSSARSRPCPSNPGPPPGSKQAKEYPRNNSTEAPVRPASCIEVKGDPLAIQEILRAIMSEQKWRISREQASAKSLNFDRFLDIEELTRFAQTEILAGRIIWTEGQAALRVTTSEAAGGFTRVQITAKFLGKGNPGQGFARPTGLWPLVSKGTLEGSIIAALESRADPSPR